MTQAISDALIDDLRDQDDGDLPLFSEAGLARLVQSTGYQSAAPFPHAVLGGVFDPEALAAILREWPAEAPGRTELHDDGTFVRKKRGTTWKTRFGPRTRTYLALLAHPAFLRVLERVTGIAGLLPDPYLFGGGLHATGVGGRLAIHADYNKHPVYRLDRRLNMLVYLNQDWSDAHGGALELWDAAMQNCVTRVLPTFNTTVIFSTTSSSFHGQPEPVAGPAGTVRRSMALYYFSNGRPEEATAAATDAEHSTLWQARPTGGY